MTYYKGKSWLLGKHIKLMHGLVCGRKIAGALCISPPPPPPPPNSKTRVYMYIIIIHHTFPSLCPYSHTHSHACRHLSLQVHICTPALRTLPPLLCPRVVYIFTCIIMCELLCKCSFSGTCPTSYGFLVIFRARRHHHHLVHVPLEVL